MDFNKYINKYVSISLNDGYYFKGRVIDCDDNSITLIDIKGRRVTLSENNILRIEEVNPHMESGEDV